MYLKKGDKVIVTTGKDKGKEGVVERVFRDKNKVVVENLNMVTKHVKPQGGEQGQRIQKEAAIHASNVMLIDPKSKKPTRVGFKIENGKKIRISKKSGEEI